MITRQAVRICYDSTLQDDESSSSIVWSGFEAVVLVSKVDGCTLTASELDCTLLTTLQKSALHLVSLVSSAEKDDFGIPFNPSGQFARNVGKFVECTECNKPRILRSARKLLCKDQENLDRVLNDTSYSCGTILKDCITDEVGNEHILNRVFVRTVKTQP